jgi:arylsulfatase A-like enzyme/Flp pilus assembly protein TadD
MKFRQIIIIAAAFTLMTCRERERPPLNVILITLDTTRADHLGCYGSNAGASPAIDRLARRGVRFEQADSAVPLTLPSHATILTGLLPQRHGLRVNGGGTLRLSHDTLATVFSRRGFRTGAFVGSFVLDHRFGLGRGFGAYDDAVARDPEGGSASLDAERPATAVADAALGWLRDTGSRPFFAWIHFYDPHAPYAPPEPYHTRFAQSPYDGEIAYADAQIARIVDYLEKSQLRDRTIIAICGDHGEGLGEHDESTHGLLLYESTLRVPMIIAGPMLPAHVVHEAVSTADLAPTLGALAGVPMNVVRLDGRDLSRDLTSKREPPPRDIYAETQYPLTFGWSDLSAFRRDGKKVISGSRDELFDLNRDPHETRNIIESDRRTYRELNAALVPLRERAAPPPAVDEETRAKLASLGYVALSAATTNAPRADPRSTTALFHDFEKATALLNSGNAAAAVVVMTSLVERDPGNRAFRSTLARALDAAGQHDRSLKLYRESVALAPNDADAWYDLAAALQDRGDPKEARSAIDEALRRDPNRADGHNMLGVALVQSGDAAAAAEEFRRAIAIDPRSARAYNNLGNALRVLGQQDDALNAYRRAAALAPRYPDPINGIGVLLVQQGRGRDALAYFDRCIAIAPDFYEAQLNRAIALETAGDRSGAAAQIEQLLATLPKSREFDSQRKTARILLARIKG